MNLTSSEDNMFLEQNNAFCNYQFGYRNNYSTDHALIESTKQIRSACDKNLSTRGVYLDLQKTFNTVNHEIIELKELCIIGLNCFSAKECNIH